MCNYMEFDTFNDIKFVIKLYGACEIANSQLLSYS